MSAFESVVEETAIGWLAEDADGLGLASALVPSEEG